MYEPFSKNSDAATSSASATSLPGLYPAFLIASTRTSRACSFDVRFGANPPSSPTAVESLHLQHRLQRVVALDSRAERPVEGVEPDGGDHEFLNVDVVVRVRAAVQDVHERHGEQLGVRAAEVAVQRHPEKIGRRAGGRHRHGERGVRAQLRLVRGAVQRLHRFVEEDLVDGLEADDRRGDHPLDVVDRLQDALTGVALGVAVAQFERLTRAGGGARGNRRAPDDPLGENHVHLDRGVPAGVQHLAGDHVFDDSDGVRGVHVKLLCSRLAIDYAFQEHPHTLKRHATIPQAPIRPQV
jgi:hypothetical protein